MDFRHVERVRAEFPALAVTDRNRHRLFFDAPGGTQVPKQVIERIGEYLTRTNANSGGPFVTSRDSDAVSEEAHRAMADLLNAPSHEEIVFGQNMTSLTFPMSRSLGRRFKAGDEILLTRMDHDGNVAPGRPRWRRRTSSFGTGTSMPVRSWIGSVSATAAACCG
jgi:selenocysteine lyase/cysteine desulfurase